MKNDFKFFLSVMIIGFFLSVGSNLSADEKLVESIIGVVTTEAQIKTDDDEVYSIGPSEKSQEVINSAGKRIEATGRLYETDGETMIVIDSFWLLGMN